jgi:hypothetical protein
MYFIHNDHQPVSADIPATFTAKFLLQEYEYNCGYAITP